MLETFKFSMEVATNKYVKMFIMFFSSITHNNEDAVLLEEGTVLLEEDTILLERDKVLLEEDTVLLLRSGYSENGNITACINS